MKCEFCENSFERHQVINGEEKDLKGRKYCLDCSPFGSRGRRKLIEINNIEELSYLKGIVDSDGSLFKRDNGTYIFSIGVMDKEYIEEVQESLSNIGLTTNIREYETENGKTRYDIQKSCKKLYDKLKNIDKDEIKPEPYLRAYYDGDGTLSTKNQIIVTSVDKENLKKVQEKLSEIGIDREVKHIKREQGFVEEYHKLYFGTKKEREIFKEKVGFSIPRKKKRLEESV